jgi:alpha-N-arabinofuranosidase
VSSQAPYPGSDAVLTIRADLAGGTLAANLQGQFAEHLGRGIYDGLWVGVDSPIPNVRGLRSDVLGALRRLHIPVLRWPGGCFAEGYHWRDGVGPRDQRPRTINASWGGVVELNAFGSHEFLDLCDQLGAVPYINGNVASGSPGELAGWLEYLTSDADSTLADLRRRHGHAEPWAIPYLGFGNEAWGCGGHMRAEQYADEYRRFATFVGSPPGGRLSRIAAGGDARDVRWTDVVMDRAGADLDAITVHHYAIPTGDWEHKGPATGFDQAAWVATLARALSIDDVLAAHEAVMDLRDPERRVALIVDEWGTWYDPEPGSPPSSLYQQNSVRDALVAALTLHVLHGHAERVRMANIAQLVNVLQAMVLTDGERIVLTPTYHAFEMYLPFQGATRIPIELETSRYRAADAEVPIVHASAALDGGGRLWLGLINLHPDAPVEVSARVVGHAGTRLEGRVLTGPAIDSVNTVAEPDLVRPGLAASSSLHSGHLVTHLPARSVTVLEVRP